MSLIHFIDIAIISRRDRKGFTFEFSPKVNMIFGGNDTGKSSLIKTLYFTLGGDCRIDNEWKNDDIITKVTISVSGKLFSFIRYKKRISIFSSDNELLVSSVYMSGIAEKIRDIFNFNLQLSHKKTGKQLQANPACLFLPFYIDQDDGWNTVLSSFSGLQMYDEWQKNTIQFHSGIKPKEYYELMGEIRTVKINLEELSITLSAVLAAKKRFEESFGRVLFDIDVEYYQNLLDRFLRKCRELNVEESEFRIQLIDLLSKRDSIADEINICKDNLASINDSITTDAVEKYHVFEHWEKLVEIIPEMYEEKQKLDNQINSIKEELSQSQRLSYELKEMMQEVKGELSLNDVIKSQASKEVEFTFDEQIRELYEKIGEFTARQEKLTKQQNKYIDKNRTKKINNDFKGFLSFAQNKLGIKSPVIAPLVQYSKITKSKTGSRSPRAIFAYHYGLLKTIEKYSTVAMLPIVIDSPKQQDLDKEGTEKLIALCTDDLALNNQVVIGAVSLEENMHGYHQIELKEKYSLLSEKNYQIAYDKIMPLYEKGMLS
ncbi:ATP-binding protein [Halomonas sp. QHL1]|uniref:ATP-binding protein n=1 Tax=Halomonas sp. QHL1 TaxID=1123773 RepID=UPI0008FD0883|nr:ATP-binding protein [Halomonas sp. QHL1]OJA07217.1 AAA family ATPase [Halomonas sp. QHL1]